MRRFLTLSAAVAVWAAGHVVTAQNPPPSTQPGAANPFPTGSYYPFGIPNQPPLFDNPSVRRDLKITDDQFNQLKQSFNRLSTTFTDEFGKVRDIKDDARLQQLRQNYTTNWGKSLSEVLKDQQQLARYRQLELQHRGLEAFGDADVQRRLNLTTEQRNRLDQLREQADRELREINRLAVSDRERAMSRYTSWHRTWQNQLNDIFTAPQRQNWSQMIGDPFAFPPSFGVTNNAPAPAPPR
jgi:hypothetical protein